MKIELAKRFNLTGSRNVVADMNRDPYQHPVGAKYEENPFRDAVAVQVRTLANTLP